MFKRRKPRGTFENMREALWPAMGWARVFHYYRHRIFRGGDSTYRVTAGLASGIAVSCTPFLGTHLIQSFFLAKILRANWVAALAGTLWGNPWTFPFLFAASYASGAWLMHLGGFEDGEMMLPTHVDLEFFIDRPWDFLAYLVGHPLELLLPMTLGSGLIAGPLFWFAAYGILYYPVRFAQAAYARQRILLRRRREDEQG
ncbi:MAG: DUF2062 domain-containing protein [Alphaproteobacteria bacterium]|nr:DUF2062 domain-containing protein [Alphaproteobacteria bacterium]